MKPFKLAGIQYAALPFRHEGRRLQVMLITSRGTRRWIIPKGWPMDGLTPSEAAVTEAAEEAGITGVVADRPIGSYRYMKQTKDEQSMAIQVLVFPFEVTGQVDEYKEQGQRESRWFSIPEAASLVAEPSLRRLIREFGKTQAHHPLMRVLHSYQTWRFGRAS